MKRADRHGRRVLTAGEVFAERLREIRADLGWSIETLARRVKKAGYGLDDATIGKIERGQRPARLEEVLALSYALGVSPIVMICPVRANDRLEVVSGIPPADDLIARRWLRGLDTLHNEDPIFFHRQQPDWEIRRELTLAEREFRTGKVVRRPWLERPKRWLDVGKHEQEEE